MFEKIKKYHYQWHLRRHFALGVKARVEGHWSVYIKPRFTPLTDEWQNWLWGWQVADAFMNEYFDELKFMPPNSLIMYHCKQLCKLQGPMQVGE